LFNFFLEVSGAKDNWHKEVRNISYEIQESKELFFPPNEQLILTIYVVKGGDEGTVGEYLHSNNWPQYDASFLLGINRKKNCLPLKHLCAFAVKQYRLQTDNLPLELKDYSQP